MAKVKYSKKGEFRLVLKEHEAHLVQALLYNVRLGNEGWNEVAADIAILLQRHLNADYQPEVSFTFEDSAGNQIKLGNIYTTIEVGTLFGEQA